FAVVNGPSHGSLTLSANGAFTYTPAANYNGPDSFTFRASDGSLASNTATFTLSVTPVNDAPVASSDSYTLTAGTTLSVAPLRVLPNASDVDGDTLTAQLVSAPGHGSLTLNANGSFSYIPAVSFTGTDTFTYQASDGSATSGITTVILTVNPPNQAGVTLEPDP